MMQRQGARRHATLKGLAERAGMSLAEISRRSRPPVSLLHLYDYAAGRLTCLPYPWWAARVARVLHLPRGRIYDGIEAARALRLAREAKAAARLGRALDNEAERRFVADSGLDPDEEC